MSALGKTFNQLIDEYMALPFEKRGYVERSLETALNIVNGNLQTAPGVDGVYDPKEFTEQEEPLFDMEG